MAFEDLNTDAVEQKDDNWSGRSDNMRCKTCICYCPKLEAIGRCRALPPTMRGWPVVYESDWCFSHKLDETKI